MNDKLSFVDIDIEIDNLMIDMNGLFHESAQKIYEYGKYKPINKRLLGNNKQPNKLRQQIRVFEDTCNMIEKILYIVKPKKRLILCVDGPAPRSKQNQQRQRRFRSAAENAANDLTFDSNCISPGTKFMDFMSKYIDWYIRKQISNNPRWKQLEIIFSNEKAPGEGEHKIINYIRSYGNKSESYCIFGNDADLIMLALGTNIPNFYILREDAYNMNKYFLIQLNGVREELSEIIKWESDKYTYDVNIAINDFIFICFIVGNDFLPHIPSIEIIEDGIEIMFDVYKSIGKTHGHLTKYKNNKVVFAPKCLKVFLEYISQYEQSILENKLSKKESYFKDELLEQCSEYKDGVYKINIEKYRKEYCNKFDDNIEQVCHEYFEGLQWVLSYYIEGVPNWRWYFPYHYAPPANILAKYVKTFKFPNYEITTPILPFQQLLSILPPKSSELIPSPLSELLTSPRSLLYQFCPSEFEIDLAGKRKEWEGIVLLPMLDLNIIIEEYNKLIGHIKPVEFKRNKLGRTFIYKNHWQTMHFKSFYGDITNHSVKTQIIDL